jgi:CelD/BcsL family acetyltransferase involved in cellulose biosynthesis
VHGIVHPQVEWRPLASLSSMAAEWGSLARRALEPNVFYEPAFAVAAATVFGGGVGALLIWSQSDPRQLVGFFPARIERFRYGLPLPVLVGWTHPYAPLGTPLVDAVCAEEAISAWLDHIATNPEFPKLILLPYLAMEGATAIVLARVLARRGGGLALFAAHARALLAPGGERTSYLERAIGPKKRKELRRQRKRLAKTRHLVSVADAELPGIAAALDDFLALEAGSWKGRAGTAARCREELAGFLAQAVTGLAQQGSASIVRLCLGRRAIAALLILRSGRTAWSWKIAHDETFAQYSPGVQVLLDATDRLLADEGIHRVDSCATANHPMVDHIWRERLSLADCLFAAAPAGAKAFALARGSESARRALINGAKNLRGRARQR